MKSKKHLSTLMAATMLVSSVAPVMAATTSSETIIGNDRHETAVKISKEGWKSAETVILVNSSAIPDALTATPLAHAKNAPILLTGKDGLNKATANEIKRLGAKDVIMIGGDAVLSAKVEKDLKALKVKVDRIKGATREETALAIAKRLDGIKDVSEIAVVNGTTGLADAVSVAAAAAEKGMPILLANPKKGLAVAEKFIKDEAIKASFVIGGKTVLPEKLVSSLPGKQRIEGLDRKDTNAKVIEKFYTGKELNNVYLAKDGMGDSGQVIDALAVGALAAKNGAPVLIASKKLSEKQIDVINTKKIDTITQVGGKGNEGAFNQLKDIEEVDIYEVGTVEELKEALEKANANDKIVLKPNATITEDIIINTDKNVDIKVEGTVTGKVEITAPNGNVTDNSTSKPSTGGSTGGTVTPTPTPTPEPELDASKKDINNVAKAGMKYEYLKDRKFEYLYTGDLEYKVKSTDSIDVTFAGNYNEINKFEGVIKDEMEHYLGGIYKGSYLQKNSEGKNDTIKNETIIEKIKYNGKEYTWNSASNNVSSWENTTETTTNLIEDISKDMGNSLKATTITLVDKKGNELNVNMNYRMKEAIAEFNGKTYVSLGKAITAAINEATGESADITVKLMKNATAGGMGIFNPKKPANLKVNLTIDLNNKVYTLEDPAVGSPGTESQGFHFEKDNKVTVKNGTVKVAPNSKKTIMMFQNYCDLTLENLKLNGGAITEYIISSNYGDMVLNNVSIDGTNSNLVGIDVMHWHGDYEDKPATLTINNTDINKINGKIDVYCSTDKQCQAESKSKLTINGGDYTGASIVQHEENTMGVIKLKGGKFKDKLESFLEDGYKFVQNSDSIWSVEKVTN